jgi:hypothetical protein
VSKVARLIIYGIVRLERKKVLMATDDIVWFPEEQVSAEV